MPRTRSLAWAQLKIGILAVASMILVTILVLALGGQGGFSWQQYTLKTTFPDVKGLKVGAVVRLAGVEVGKVTAVDFAGADVQVTLGVNEEMQSRITDKSRAMLGSLSLLGEPVVDITASTEGTPLKDGDVIPAERTPGQITDVAESANESLVQATALLKEIRGGRGTVGKLFTEDNLYRELTAFVTSAQTVADTVNRGQGTLGLLVKDPAAYRDLSEALKTINETTRRISAGEGSLGRLLKDDAMAKSLTSATAGLDQVATRLNKGEGTAGKLLTDRELFDRFNSLAGRIDRLAASLEQGQGTAGQFLQNKQLYENINSASSELRQLIADIRKDPKKYLNVRVSIF
jgi:phospholipid/cholesterol/gamma-HCH transport system substrate-binding protein